MLASGSRLGSRAGGRNPGLVELLWGPLKLYYTILYYTILYYTILYYTILYYTILYYTILYCTVLYYADYPVRILPQANLHGTAPGYVPGVVF